MALSVFPSLSPGRTNGPALSCSCPQPYTGKSLSILHSLQKTIICLAVIIFCFLLLDCLVTKKQLNNMTKYHNVTYHMSLLITALSSFRHCTNFRLVSNLIWYERKLDNTIQDFECRNFKSHSCFIFFKGHSACQDCSSGHPLSGPHQHVQLNNVSSRQLLMILFVFLNEGQHFSYVFVCG